MHFYTLIANKQNHMFLYCSKKLNPVQWLFSLTEFAITYATHPWLYLRQCSQRHLTKETAPHPACEQQNHAWVRVSNLIKRGKGKQIECQHLSLCFLMATVWPATSCYCTFPRSLTKYPQTVSRNKPLVPEVTLVRNFVTTRQPGSGGKRITLRIKGVQTSYQEPILKIK